MNANDFKVEIQRHQCDVWMYGVLLPLLLLMVPFCCLMEAAWVYDVDSTIFMDENGMLPVIYA